VVLVELLGDNSGSDQSEEHKGENGGDLSHVISPGRGANHIVRVSFSVFNLVRGGRALKLFGRSLAGLRELLEAEFQELRELCSVLIIVGLVEQLRKHDVKGWNALVHHVLVVVSHEDVFFGLADLVVLEDSAEEVGNVVHNHLEVSHVHQLFQLAHFLFDHF